MHTLVLGANGLLGSNVVRAAANRGWDVAGTFHSSNPDLAVPLERLDIRDAEQVEEVLDSYAPAVVVNCAAMTDVDGCESSPDVAQAINADAPARIASYCGANGIDFVHVSTDYVFDGTSDSLYTESDEPNPLQVYGETKLLGEQRVRQSAAESIIPRLSFVYGVHRATDELTGFPAWVTSRLEDGTPTPLFTDQRVTPTRAGHAASAILDLLETDFRGTVHVASRSCVTPHDFGKEIGRRLDADTSLIEPGSRAAVDRAAARPEYTCLQVERIESILERSQPSLETDLDAIEPWLGG